MALIQCPECCQTVSDKATKCPKCGYPIQSSSGVEIMRNGEQKTNNEELILDTSDSSSIMEKPVKKKKGKVFIVILIILIVALFVVAGFFAGYKLLKKELLVKDVSISKWKLTDSTDYSDYYEATLESEQIKPFVAVIGQYESNDVYPQFVYMENGRGVLETVEGTDKDPSTKYKAIGYMSGDLVNESDVSYKYTEGEYNDYEYIKETSCSVDISIDMKNSKTGLLILDIIDETSNNTEKNYVATVVDGKAECYYYADLPYKSRGIDILIVPKVFCESKDVEISEYTVEEPYATEKDESTYFTSYSGKETLSFKNYNDGIVIYTYELIEGGEKKYRNMLAEKRYGYIINEKDCKFEGKRHRHSWIVEKCNAI
ncbi:MAG: hypothetical protein IJ416_06865 [Ruminiclostridium sp.]|nr:hypothetical protein [Ruminiclostridium sp.]